VGSFVTLPFFLGSQYDTNEQWRLFTLGHGGNSVAWAQLVEFHGACVGVISVVTEFMVDVVGVAFHGACAAGTASTSWVLTMDSTALPGISIEGASGVPVL
jgi:hypothetical protein